MPLFVRHKKPGPLKPQANPYPSRFYGWRNSLGITLVVILITAGTFRLYKPIYIATEQSFFEGTAWIQGIFIQPFYETQALLKDTYVLMHLKEEHGLLKAENERLKYQIQTLAPFEQENAILRKNLNIPNLEKYGDLSARVLSTPYDGVHHFFLIAAGEKEGLEKNQAVISPEGVVGRLEKVGKYVTRVLLLNDPSSRIPVKTMVSEQKAILAGEGGFMPTLVYIGDERKIQKGEKVETSGIGGIFPPGLPVGIIEDISHGRIRVRPYAPLQDLDWVVILKNNPDGFLEELSRIQEGE